MKNNIRGVLIGIIIIGLLVGCSSKSEVPTRGEWINGVYINEYAKLNFRNPDQWEYLEDEKIADLMDISIEEIAGINGYTKKALMKSALYDMMSVHSGEGSNVIVMYENLKATRSTNINVDEYLLTLQNNMTELQGYPREATNVDEDVFIGGERYKVLKTQLTPNGNKQCFYLRKFNDYIICIIITTGEGSSVEEILENFS